MRAVVLGCFCLGYLSLFRAPRLLRGTSQEQEESRGLQALGIWSPLQMSLAVPQASDCHMYKAVSVNGVPATALDEECAIPEGYYILQAKLFFLRIMHF